MTNTPQSSKQQVHRAEYVGWLETEIDRLTRERDHAYNVLGWCIGCDMPQAECEKGWRDQRKCCPDCSHTGPAAAPESRDG